jgi:1-aminocyclopropane-1-carboxylate deaminase
MSFSFSPPRIESLSSLYSQSVNVDVLRLDVVHPIVSGNKWFKLKAYINAAKAEGKKTLLTFGGAYSNHIIATAAAAQMHGLKSIGVIRGEEAKNSSPTLLAARSYGMELHFVSRESYREKIIPSNAFQQNETELCIIPEGGYGALGMQGAKDILSPSATQFYSHILVAVGTGTTLAGLLAGSLPHQKVIGVPVLKNAFSLQQEIEKLLPKEKHAAFELIPEYYFNGYAKHTPDLLKFMNGFYETTNIPTDFVYTGKAFFAAFDLLQKGYFGPGSKILLVHTGGLQGNGSLKKGALIFG